MAKNTKTSYSKLAILRTVLLVVVISALPLLNLSVANAAPILGRSVALSSSVADASGVTYSLTTSALPTNGTPIKSVEIKFCDSLSGACSMPSGFSSAASSLVSQPSGLGANTGWTASTSNSGSLRIFNGSNATNPSGAVSIVWNGVHNPTASNAIFYGVITTFSDSGWASPVDSGSVALSTSSQVQVSLTVNEALTFCTGTSITGQNCATATGSIVNLGSGSTTAPATGTSVMAASTNGDTGYTISVNGSTLASGSYTIDALATGGVSSPGTKQFGLNLTGANTTPVVGAVRTGLGTAAATVNYGTNNNFRFASGEQVVTSVGPTDSNTFTIGYIANIDGLTPAGVYTTNLNYIATANF